MSLIDSINRIDASTFANEAGSIQNNEDWRFVKEVATELLNVLEYATAEPPYAATQDYRDRLTILRERTHATLSRAQGETK